MEGSFKALNCLCVDHSTVQDLISNEIMHEKRLTDHDSSSLFSEFSVVEINKASASPRDRSHFHLNKLEVSTGPVADLSSIPAAH
ncbi:hypothetical protein DPMN_189059 [Dreissena polymorpha]|uniref:Uncharacterized protein n=1 Tax=Dreissena polymorpha TaxID=45954 RepID=A0A9D4I947_DREPO|nr:hypothetical protein DPMN_189059 [Dreissena polymorpha]